MTSRDGPRTRRACCGIPASMLGFTRSALESVALRLTFHWPECTHISQRISGVRLLCPKSKECAKKIVNFVVSFVVSSSLPPYRRLLRLKCCWSQMSVVVSSVVFSCLNITMYRLPFGDHILGRSGGNGCPLNPHPVYLRAIASISNISTPPSKKRKK
jgi:hypothetical protein